MAVGFVLRISFLSTYAINSVTLVKPLSHWTTHWAECHANINVEKHIAHDYEAPKEKGKTKRVSIEG